MTLKRIIPWLLLVLLLPLITFVLLSREPTPPSSARLPDGTIVTLEDVTYGKSHSFIFGKPYQKTLHRVLPAKLRKLSGARLVFTYVTANINDPVFWLAFNSNKPPQSLTLTVLDEYGAELDRNVSSITYYAQNRSGMTPLHIVPHAIDTQAPHGNIVGICLYSDSSKTNKLAQFMIPGASVVSIPATNSTLPVVKSAGALSVELTSLVTGLKAVPHNQSRATNEFFTQARFRIANKSDPIRRRTAESIKIFNTNGTANSVAFCNGFIGDDLIVNFDRHLDQNIPCNFEIQLSSLSDSLDFTFAVNPDLCFAFQAIPTRHQSTNTATSK